MVTGVQLLNYVIFFYENFTVRTEILQRLENSPCKISSKSVETSLDLKIGEKHAIQVNLTAVITNSGILLHVKWSNF